MTPLTSGWPSLTPGLSIKRRARRGTHRAHIHLRSSAPKRPKYCLVSSAPVSPYSAPFIGILPDQNRNRSNKGMPPTPIIEEWLKLDGPQRQFLLVRVLRDLEAYSRFLRMGEKRKNTRYASQPLRKRFGVRLKSQQCSSTDPAYQTVRYIDAKARVPGCSASGMQQWTAVVSIYRVCFLNSTESALRLAPDTVVGF